MTQQIWNEAARKWVPDPNCRCNGPYGGPVSTCICTPQQLARVALLRKVHDFLCHVEVSTDGWKAQQSALADELETELWLTRGPGDPRP